jgi:phosphoglucomutase
LEHLARHNVAVHPIDQARRWLLLAVADPDLAQELAPLIAAEDAPALADRFYRSLAFGTGGLRGRIGAGTNRMNVYTVRQASQGVADHVAAGVPGGRGSVAIAFDTRQKSRLFAGEAARVLAAAGHRVWLFDRPMPTPMLSFAVRELGCDAGVCITASHNPATDNGYKVYGSDGAQITQGAADAIAERIGRVDPFEDVALADADDAVRAGWIRTVGEEVVDGFVAAELALRCEEEPDGAVRVAYTPLHGTGLECVERVLRAAGVGELTVVPEQAEPDGAFPTCPSPNPEEPEAMARVIAVARDHGADVALATDPDCDRVGVAVRASFDAGDTEFVRLTGNEIGVLLLDYVCRRRRAGLGLPWPGEPLAVKTIVTTALARAVAAHHGVEIAEVLTGFKYIGEVIGRLDAAGQADRFVLGFEESCGYLSGTHVRDKDGVNAALLICDMAAWHARRGVTLLGALAQLADRHGHYATGLDSHRFAGEAGLEAMQGIMAKMRAHPPAAIVGIPVTAVVDFLADDGAPTASTGLPSSDVVQFQLADSSTLTIRPSGTEPKIKVYTEVVGASAADAAARLARVREAWQAIW